MIGSFNLIATPNPGGYAHWTLYDPMEHVVTLANPTHPLKEALALCGQANATWSGGTSAGPGYNLFARGFCEQSGGAAILLIDDTCDFYPSQGQHYVFDNVTLSNDGCMQQGKPMLRANSMLMTRIEGPGSQIAMGYGNPPIPWSTNMSGFVIQPRDGVPQSPAPGAPIITDSSIWFSSLCSMAILTNGAPVGSFEINADEINCYGSDIGFYVSQNLPVGDATGLVLRARHLHGFRQVGVSIGMAPPAAGQRLGCGGLYEIGGISADGMGGTIGFLTFGSSDDARLCIVDPALTRPVVCSASSAHNRFRVPYSVVPLPAALAGTDNLFAR